MLNYFFVCYMANLFLGAGQVIKYTFFFFFGLGGEEGRIKETRTCMSLDEVVLRSFPCPLIWLLFPANEKFT